MKRCAPTVLVATALIALACAGCGSAVTGSGSTASAAGTSAATGAGSTGAGPTSTPSSTGTSASPTAPAGSSSVRPAIAFRTLTGRQTAVALSSEFVAALAATRVVPGTAGNARVQGTQILLPVSGGNLTIYRKGAVDPYLQGSVEHRGAGFTLDAGGIKIGLLDFTVQFGRTPIIKGRVTLNGKSFATDLDLLSLDLATLRTPVASGRTVTLSGPGVTLTPGLAQALNTSFSTKAFTGGLQVGALTSTLTGTS